MSVTHTVTKTYSGGGPSAIGVSTSHTGQSEVDFSAACNGSATTTLSPVLIIDPDTDVECYMLRVTGGNATVHFDGSSSATTDTTIALTDGVAEIQETSAATGLISGLPTASDTYTIKVRNANSGSITFEGRFLVT